MPRLIRIENFTHAAQLISRCRNPANGKPINSWCRIYRTVHGISFRLESIKAELGYLTPDNIFTFTLSSSQAYAASHIVSTGLHKVTPFAWNREGMKRYSVKHIHSKYESDTFDGLKFNYVTGEAINPQTIDTSNVNPEARRQWLRSVKEYKRGIKLRIRMGVFDSIIPEVIRERSSQNRYEWSQPDWFSDHWLDRLANAIKYQDFSLDLLKGITQTAEVSYWNRSITSEEVTVTLDKLIKNLSVQLRVRFGVFEQESCHEKLSHRNSGEGRRDVFV